MSLGREKSEKIVNSKSSCSSFPRLCGPPFNFLASTAHLQALHLDTLHPRRVLEPGVGRHAAGVGALVWNQLEHGCEKGRDALGLVLLEVVLFAQDVGEGPVAEAVNVAQLAAAVKDFLGPFARQACAWKGTEKLNDLGHMVVVFAVFGARLGVKEVVAGNEFKDLYR